VGELDGVWAVERVSGALPPLFGCVKRIHGSRGTTEFPHVPGLPFEVRGRELHYPLGLFVDKLEPQNGAYLGRATLLGRELGQFTMRRLDAMRQLKEQLIKHVDEAHAMERNPTDARDDPRRTIRRSLTPSSITGADAGYGPEALLGRIVIPPTVKQLACSRGVS
jgi:hypothetical protein